MFVRGLWVKRPSGWLKFDYDDDDDYDDDYDFFVHRDTEFIFCRTQNYFPSVSDTFLMFTMVRSQKYSLFFCEFCFVTYALA